MAPSNRAAIATAVIRRWVRALIAVVLAETDEEALAAVSSLKSRLQPTDARQPSKRAPRQTAHAHGEAHDAHGDQNAAGQKHFGEGEAAPEDAKASMAHLGGDEVAHG